MSAFVASLLLAFASVESSNRNLPAYHDVSGVGFGYYGFHYDRWVECGGSPATFGIATKTEQDWVMTNALHRYLRHKPVGVDPVRWVATYHNIGHGVNRETHYVQKIRKALK